MGFQLVPKSVTLNDLQRRNDRYLAFFHGISFGTDYFKVVEGRRIQCAMEM